jgi:hypothetical protein
VEFSGFVKIMICSWHVATCFSIFRRIGYSEYAHRRVSKLVDHTALRHGGQRRPAVDLISSAA